MSNWQGMNLGNVLERIEGGGTPSKQNPEYWSGTIPWASVKDLTSFNPNGTQDYISEEGLKNSSSRLVKAGTLITPTRMALGFTVRFNVDVAINQDLKALYPKDFITTDFINYWFEANRSKIEKLGIGSTVAGIQASELKSQKINVPEKPEQMRIVSVLEVWDEYIEKLEQKIALKEQLRNGLMQQLLTGKLRLPRFNNEWKTTRISDVVIVNPSGMSLPDNFPYIDLEIVEKGRLVSKPRIISKDKAPSRAQRILKSGDVLFQTVRPYQKNNYYFDMEGETYVASTGYAQLRAKGSPRFLYHFLLSDHFVKDVLSMCTGSNYPAITSSDLGKISVKYPDPEEQHAVEKPLTTLSDEIDTLRSKIEELKKQKKYLLKNFLTGTIRTPENLTPRGDIA